MGVEDTIINVKMETTHPFKTKKVQAIPKESAEGKILYRVIADDQETSCTCADFTRNSKKDPNFQCKHILSVLNCVPTGDVEPVQYLERKKPKLDERWIIEIEGNQFVKYAGLLDLGHQKGISQIEVEPLQLPTKENGNSAICKATVISKSGESFTDIGVFKNLVRGFKIFPPLV